VACSYTAITTCASGDGCCPAGCDANNDADCGTPPITGTFAYVANLSSNSVSVISTNDNTVVNTIPVGVEPIRLAFSPDGNRAYVANQTSNNVSVIDTCAGAVIATVDVAPTPHEVAVSRDGQKVYVTRGNGETSTGTLTIIDTATNGVVATLPISNWARGVAFSADGSKVLVGGGCADCVSVLSYPSNTVLGTIHSTGMTASRIQFLPDNVSAYVNSDCGCCGNVKRISTTTNSVVWEQYHGGWGDGLAVAPGGGAVYVGTLGHCGAGPQVKVFDPATNAQIGAVATTGHTALAVTPDGSTLYGVSCETDEVMAISTSNLIVTAVIPVGSFPMDIAIAQTCNPASTTCASGDGSCPAGCNANNDADCPPACGNGVVEAGETCDLPSTCPASCDDGNACTIDQMTGSAANCNVACSYTAITTCASGDGCCPAGCNSLTDADCPPSPTVIATILVGGQGGILALNPTTERLYVGQDPAHSVAVVDILTNTVVATIPTAGYQNVGIATNPVTGRVYISQGFANRVLVVDGATNTPLADVHVPSSDTIAGVEVNPNTNRIYVARNTPGGIITMDGATNTCGPIIDLGSGLRSISSFGMDTDLATNRIYIGDRTMDRVVLIDGNTDQYLKAISVGSDPLGVAVNSTAHRAYVCNYGSDTLAVLDLDTDTVLATLAVGTDPVGVAVDPYTNRVYVTNSGGDDVSIVDGGTNTVIATVVVGNAPTGVAVDPTTHLVYVAHGDTISVLRDALCTPRSCVELGANCGILADGCGGSLDCGTCVAGQGF
jgi:YVTN family beta-propeller protein